MLPWITCCLLMYASMQALAASVALGKRPCVSCCLLMHKCVQALAVSVDIMREKLPEQERIQRDNEDFFHRFASLCLQDSYSFQIKRVWSAVRLRLL